MFYSDLLDVHESYPSDRPEILGDGYLMAENAVYRGVIEFALSLGCRFEEAQADYLLLPFHQLPKIIASKRIPFVPNARLMKDVEGRHPGVFATEEMPLPESFHMHEAAHVIAEHFIGQVEAIGPREAILKALLAESFANAIDALAAAQVQDEMHFFFIRQNCYMHPRGKVGKAMRALGTKLAFRLAYFTYLRANFLTKPLTLTAAKKLVGKKAEKDLKTVCEIGERLDPLFRVTTTGNYLKQHGFRGDLQDLLDFPFMEVFDSKPEFKKVVEQFESWCDNLS